MEVSLSSIRCELDNQQSNPVKCSIGHDFVQRYEVLNSVGEGTYGLVLRCVHKCTGTHVAIKKFKESKDEGRVGLANPYRLLCTKN